MTGGPGPATRRGGAFDLVFPGASSRSRWALGAAFVGLTVLLLGLSLLRWQAPLVGLVGLGLPLLFVLHLWNLGALGGRVAFVATVGAVLGTGWAVAADAAMAAVGPDALGTPVGAVRLLTTGLVLPLAFLGLLLALVGATRPRLALTRSPLQGCLIGALAGYSMAAASTLTGLASQLDDGVLADGNRTATTLATAAIVQGLASPLTAAGVGGAYGARSSQPLPRNGIRRHTLVDTAAVPIAGGVAVYVARGLLDTATWSGGAQLVSYGTIALLALAMQRLVLRAAPPSGALRERAGDSPARIVALAGLGAALVMATATVLALWATPPVARYVCPPNCGRPPLRQPVAANPRFTAAGGEFSVSYPGSGTAYTATFEPAGVVLTLSAGEGGTLRLSGEPAAGRSARQVVEDVMAAAQPDARVDYEIPNALVGYRLGYGVVADVFSVGSIRDDSRLRVLVMAAIKDDYALIAAGAGRFHEFSPDFGSGHPSGANFLLALDMGKYVNSFTWRGDPPR